jgi:hypothetical protein
VTRLPFLPGGRKYRANSRATKTLGARAGSMWASIWISLARVGIRLPCPPLRLIDFQSAEIAKKRARYTHPASKGARVLDLEQYRRTHEILRRRAHV